MTESELPAEQLVHILFQDSPDALFLVDADHRKVLDANRTAKQWTGLNRQDLLATRFDHLLRWHDQARHADASYSVETAFQGRPALLMLRTAALMPVQAAVVSLPGPKANRVHLIVARDARPLRALESGNKALMERLATLESEIGQLRESHPGPVFFGTESENDLSSAADLVQSIAKHFNDLATVVVASATLVRGAINSNSPNQRFLQAIDEASRRASDMFGLLLGAVGRTPVHRREVTVTSVVHDALKNAHLPENVRIASGREHSAVTLAVDPNLAGLALQHVLQNAVDAMPGGGQISLNAVVTQIDREHVAKHGEDARPGTFARFEVTDTGRGMDPETLRRAGTPFFTTKNDPKKMGLGLAFTKGISRLHGGWVELTSTPGAGTQVSLYLPMKTGNSLRR